MDEERIHSKKYKIFFKTILHGRMSEEELNGLWEQMESSLSNPYAFDQLIEEVKIRREQEMESCEESDRLTKEQLRSKPKVRAASAPDKVNSETKKVGFSTPQKRKYQRELPQKKTVQEER
jgi:hypothetical protein